MSIFNGGLIVDGTIVARSGGEKHIVGRWVFGFNEKITITNLKTGEVRFIFNDERVAISALDAAGYEIVSAQPAIPTGMARGFSQLSKSWYGKNMVTSDSQDEITIGIYADDGGSDGEFDIEWHEALSPELRVRSDSWQALLYFSDLLELMASVDIDDVPPDEFAKMLEGIGVKNITKTEYGD